MRKRHYNFFDEDFFRTSSICGNTKFRCQQILTSNIRMNNFDSRNQLNPQGC